MAGLFKFENGSLYPGDGFREAFSKAENGADGIDKLTELINFGVYVAGGVAVAGARIAAQEDYTEKGLLGDLGAFAEKVREMQPPVTEDTAHLAAFEIGIGANRQAMYDALAVTNQGGNA